MDCVHLGHSQILMMQLKNKISFRLYQMSVFWGIWGNIILVSKERLKEMMSSFILEIAQ